ncbi:MAG: DNA replication/repair protein RecF [Candidatus Aureabacteria bacterium]|nr:DNA replication/repair protein RecF [Candidatus Auribacterota bacterium]
MWIKDFTIIDFRNIYRAELELCPCWNVFFGKNAQGKTNILEAIYFLSTLRSFKTKNISEIPRYGVESFLLQAQVETATTPKKIKALYGKSKKNFFLNSESITTIEKIIGLFPIVLFTNDNLDLVMQSPLALRRFLDIQLSQSIPDYLKTLIQYEKVLRFRNVLLKKEGASARRQLKVWTQKLISLGSGIYKARIQAIKRLSIFARLNLKKISYEREELELQYVSQVDGEDEVALAKNYEKKLEESSLKERERKYTLVGPHRDNLCFLLDKRPANKFASAGQRKSIGIALKLAEAENIKSFSASEPALLLDEIFNELDEDRRENLYKIFGEKRQIFCMTTEKSILNEILKSRKSVNVFKVEKGNIAK